MLQLSLQLPLVLGWVSVGTQIDAKNVDEAIRKTKLTNIGHDANGQHDANPMEQSQKAITVRTENAKLDGWEDRSCTLVALWCGSRVRGDEAQPGPIFTYARIWTWRQFCVEVMEQLYIDHEDTPRRPTASTEEHSGSEDGGPLHSILNQEGIPLQPLHDQSRLVARVDTAVGSARGVSRNSEPASAAPRSTISPEAYGRLQIKHNNEPLSNDPDIAKTFILASLIGCALQWGTTGPSILIAYNTPTVGLGCSSGSYLVYGVAATIAWASLILSQLLSHLAMISSVQDAARQEPQSTATLTAADGASQPENVATPPSPKWPPGRTLMKSLLHGSAVITRIFGQVVAFLNGCWLLVASFFEIIGLYDNCMCKAVEFSWHEKGWLVLFKSNSQLAIATQPVWAGGIAWMTISTIAIAVFFRMGSQSSFR